MSSYLYPLITADPAECRRWAAWDKNGPDYYARDRLQENLGHLGKLLAKASMVVACWGDIARNHDHIEWVLEEIACARPGQIPIYCLGTTKSGAPKHPMARGKHRVPDDQRPVLWKTL